MRVYSFAGRNTEGGFALVGRLEFPRDDEAEAADRAAEKAVRATGRKKYQPHGLCRGRARKQKPALPSICPTCGSSLPAA